MKSLMAEETGDREIREGGAGAGAWVPWTGLGRKPASQMIASTY